MAAICQGDAAQCDCDPPASLLLAPEGLVLSHGLAAESSSTGGCEFSPKHLKHSQLSMLQQFT